MPTPGSRASAFLSLQTFLKRRDRMQFSNSPHRNLLDGIAIAGSALCLIHCLALPLIIAWLPALSDWLSWPESVHLWILLAALPLSFFALWRHALCEGRKVPFLLGMAGLAIMASALLIEGSPLEPFVTSIGAALLAAAHILNWRGRRSCHEGELRQ